MKKSKTNLHYFITILCLVFSLNMAYATWPPISCPTNCPNATEVDLMQKYWNYKERFQKYFTKIGSGQGHSLQAASVEYWGNGKMYFGDTGAGLGDYFSK